MVHPRLGLLLRLLLGTMLLVSGSIPPVRYGHTHAHHGEHEHHAWAENHIPGLIDPDHDMPVLESGLFHWHGWLPGQMGPLASNPGESPVRTVLTTAWISCSMAIVAAPSAEVDDLESFGFPVGLFWHPPPGFSAEVRIPSGSDVLTPLHLHNMSSVLIRC
jgi:hypothetical protein